MDAISPASTAPTAASVPSFPSRPPRAALAGRLQALIPAALREPLASLRRDLQVVARGLAGRHPPPLLPRRPPRSPQLSGAAVLTPRTVRIDEVVRETADALTLWLRDPSGAPMPFVPGQFFTLLVSIDGQTLRRAYSVSSCAADASRVAITCKRVPGGRVSSYLHEQAQVGMALKVLGPSGNFTVAPDPGRARRYVLLGGGSGITPLMAITRAVLRAEPRSQVALIFGNRSADDIIFSRELAALSGAHPERFTLRHVLEAPPQGWAGGTGLLDEQTLDRELQELPPAAAELGEPGQTEYFLCGPAGMMAAAHAVLQARGVPAAQVHEERFASPHLPATVRPADRAAQTAELRRGSEVRRLTVRPDETLLEAGLRSGAAMPFSCAMGGCGACKVKLDSGQVVMQEPNCLTAEERAAGYVLACVASPCTAVAVELP